MDRLEEFLYQMEDGAFAVDARRRIVFWNSACERLLGKSSREALGTHCFEVVRANAASGDRYCGARCAMAGLARGGAAPQAMPLWISSANGTRQPFWLRVMLMPSPQPEQWKVMHVLQRRPQDQWSFAGAAAPRRDWPPAAKERVGEPSEDGAAALTPREREILDLLAQGYSGAVIARRLYLSPVTIRNHVQHLICKLGLHSQLEAVAYAYRNGLVTRAPRPALDSQAAVV